MRCVIYRRVSTDMQVEEGFSLEAQRNRLHAYVESQGWTIVGDYCDEGFSAKNTDRPQMQRLISDIKNKKFDVVLVYRLDRFVRSVLDLHELLQLMDKYEVKFKSATEVFDTTSATGRLFITMIATLAQWERETIAERVHMGMLKKAEQGQRNGAPAPYGYDLFEGNLIINQDESKWVKYIFSRYGSVGSHSIAKELNKKGVLTKKGEVWSDFSVRYILRNPIYSGAIRWNYESTSKGIRKRTGEETISSINQVNFEPLIDKDAFDIIQKTLETRSVSAFRSDNFYPFSGIAKCEKCGYGYTGASKELKSGGIHRFYKCRGRFNFGICNAQAISEDVIEDSFLELLSVVDVEISMERPNESASSEDLLKQMQQLTKRKERAEELYIDGDISRDRYAKLLEDIRSDEAKCLIQISTTGDVESIGAVKELLGNLKREWRNFSFETRKQAVHSLFESITIRIDQKAIPKRQKAIISITDYSLI